jgi:predicted Zn-dependent protease
LYDSEIVLDDAGAVSGDLTLKASEFSASLLLLKNSRENELQADSEGIKIMHLAGYNPRAMINIQTMFLRLSKGKNSPASSRHRWVTVDWDSLPLQA